MNNVELTDIYFEECGLTAKTSDGGELVLQLPITGDSVNTLDGVEIDYDTARGYEKYLDEYFGQGDRTLARLCYAGGMVYESYTVANETSSELVVDNETGNVVEVSNTQTVYTTDNGDKFVEHELASYYNKEIYKQIFN